MTLTLITGGVRSGKSRLAESLFDGVNGVTYIATGPQSDDADWLARVEAHQRRRPASWRSVATPDAASALEDADGPVLLDCLGTWLTAQLDAVQAWEAPREEWLSAFAPHRDRLIAALGARLADTVVVTNEVGWGVVSAYRSGRVFADELGRLNQDVAAVADTVIAVMAGLPLALKGQLPA